MSLKVVVVASLVVAAWSVGCGSDPTSAVDEPAGGPAARAVEPTGSRLRERAVELYAHMSQERWADVHRYLSPAIRDGCPAERFTERMALGWTYAKALFGLPEDEMLRLEVRGVAVEDTRGRVQTELFARGESFGATPEEDSEAWVYTEGDWRYEIEITDDGCPEGLGDEARP